MKRNKSAKLNIVTAVLLLLVLPVLWIAGAFVLPAQYDDTFLGELKYKEERLRSTEGKRLVLVGGSALVFGVDSALLSDAFPEYEIVNMGMYAALGTTVMFDLTARELREGDVVVVVPEQDPQTLSDYFNAEMMWQAVDGAPGLLTKLPREKLGQMTGELPYFASEKWKNLLTGTVMTPDEVYVRSNFNVYGDLDCAAADHNIMPEQYDTGKVIYFDTDVIDDAFVTALNEYVREAQENGAQVWYHFPPMNARAVLESKPVNAHAVMESMPANARVVSKSMPMTAGEEPMHDGMSAEGREDESDAIDDYYGYLSGLLDCEIAGDPHDAVMDARWFYDTNFHLNQSGKIIYTAQLIRDLKAMMGITAATEVALPQIPGERSVDATSVDNKSVESPSVNNKEKSNDHQSQTEKFASGDDRDAGYFTYEVRGASDHEESDTSSNVARKASQEVTIIGLTAEGKRRDALVIPTRIDGMPVTAITAETLQEASHLKEVTLQPNIHSLPNGMFAGCDSLQRIRLQGARPMEMLVSEGLLDGAPEHVHIVVDADQVTAFKTNYSWSTYRDKIQGE